MDVDDSNALAAGGTLRLAGGHAGSQGTTGIWLRIGAGRYVSGAYVVGVPTVGTC